jgi:hypothetical protein
MAINQRSLITPFHDIYLMIMGCTGISTSGVVIEKIKTKNDALLNMKHENQYVRYHCELILKGKDTWDT